MPKNSPQNGSPQNDLMENYTRHRLAVFGQVSLITVIGMAIIGGVSYWIDKQLGTFPALFIVGLVLAYPLIQVTLYRKYKNYRFKK